MKNLITIVFTITTLFFVNVIFAGTPYAAKQGGLGQPQCGFHQDAIERGAFRNFVLGSSLPGYIHWHTTAVSEMIAYYNQVTGKNVNKEQFVGLIDTGDLFIAPIPSGVTIQTTCIENGVVTWGDPRTPWAAGKIVGESSSSRVYHKVAEQGLFDKTTGKLIALPGCGGQLGKIVNGNPSPAPPITESTTVPAPPITESTTASTSQQSMTQQQQSGRTEVVDANGTTIIMMGTNGQQQGGGYRQTTVDNTSYTDTRRMANQVMVDDGNARIYQANLDRTVGAINNGTRLDAASTDAAIRELICSQNSCQKAGVCNCQASVVPTSVPAPAPVVNNYYTTTTAPAAPVNTGNYVGNTQAMRRNNGMSRAEQRYLNSGTAANIATTLDRGSRGIQRVAGWFGGNNNNHNHNHNHQQVVTGGYNPSNATVTSQTTGNTYGFNGGATYNAFPNNPLPTVQNNTGGGTYNGGNGGATVWTNTQGGSTTTGNNYGFNNGGGSKKVVYGNGGQVSVNAVKKTVKMRSW